MAHDAPGMKGYRSRTESGPLREKRGDTHFGSIEQKYHRDFNVRDDMHQVVSLVTMWRWAERRPTEGTRD
jgi:hypothetical protein